MPARRGGEGPAHDEWPLPAGAWLRSNTSVAGLRPRLIPMHPCLADDGSIPAFSLAFAPIPVPMTDRTETGMDYLASGSWLPPPVDAASVMTAIREQRYEACAGRVTAQGVNRTNVVERLAVAYALLRTHPDESQPPTIMWETLESLGVDVSPSFAECGSDAYYLFYLIDDLQRGREVDPVRRIMGFQCLGRLWAAAFSAPPGYAHYIARSAMGGERQGLAFFHAATRPDKLSAEDQIVYLRRLLDLLQAAIEIKELPDSAVGRRMELPEWRSPVWAVNLKHRGGRSWRIEVHAQQEQLGSRHCVRHTVKLVEAGSKDTVASIRAVVMEGETGSYDDFLDLGHQAGPTVGQIIDSVFAADSVVSLYPRVRWLLEAADNRVFRLMVIEGMYASPLWRRRGIGKLLLEQLIVEADMVDAMIGRPTAIELDEAQGGMTLGVQAGYAAARLTLARYFASFGAEYLISGTMGMRLAYLQRLHAQGIAAREG